MASASGSNGDIKQAFIIGVDFGTTYSGVAWCYTGDPKSIRTIKSWPPNSNQTSEKVPSVIQYGARDSSRYKWGFEVTSEAQNPLRWFKLLLNERSPGTISGRAPTTPPNLSETHSGDSQQLSMLLKTISALPEDKTPVGVVTDYLRGIYQHTRDTLEKAFPRSFISGIGTDIGLEFVLTVPAIWNDAAKDLTLQAARAAGMNESYVKIKTVSEPEAAAVHCLKIYNQSRDSLKPGDVYVIADCGGGTVDLISYEITSVEPRLRVDECVGGTGGLCGSTALNRRFEILVKERLGIQQWENMSSVSRSHTMRHFDEYLKPTFCPPEFTDEEDDDFDIETFHSPVPGVPDDTTRGVHGGHLVLSTEEMKSIFDPTFVQIRDLVQQQISAAEAKTGAPVTGVLLVGGFGSSAYLFKYLSANLRAMDGNPVKILQPPDAWSAIACGAVSYGLSVRDVREGFAPAGSGTVGSRLARFSYGVTASEPFFPGLHPSNKMYFSPLTGSFWCRGRMQWFVKKDERIEDGKDIQIELARHCSIDAERDQLVFPERVYACDLARAPRDVEHKDVHHLLTFTADLNDTSREFFKRKDSVLGEGAYYEIPLGMIMRLESGCLEFSCTVGGRTMGKGSANYDHEAPAESQEEPSSP